MVILATVVLTHPHRRVPFDYAQGRLSFVRPRANEFGMTSMIESILFLADLAVIQTRAVLEQKATIAL